VVPHFCPPTFNILPLSSATRTSELIVGCSAAGVKLRSSWQLILADCTNGRAYATVLRLSSVCRLSTLSVICIVGICG